MKTYVFSDEHNCDHTYVLAADAQATIAALQARVQELEAIKIPDDAFTYCAYCGEKSPVDEHNEDLSAHIKVCPKHPMRDVESQLTQRTAELEAANGSIEAARRVNNDLQAELERVRSLIKALPKVEGEYLTKEYIEVKVPVLRGTARLSISDELIALLQHRQGMEGV